MEKSEHAKASEGQDGVDYISNLPDCALQLILSGIPTTEEVVRTSILSRRWRYLWTSVPSIDIDYARELKPSKEFKTDKFREFVYWVLLKPLDLDRFRLWCYDYYTMSTIQQWIHFAVMRKVKVLDLMFCLLEDSGDIEMPQCLVTCSSLEVLRLCLIGMPLSVPKITGFPALRVVELNDVDLNEDDADSVKYFLESCPLLEDLSLIDCTVYGEQHICISSGKLKSLKIENHYEEIGESEYLRMCETIEISCPKLESLKLIGAVSYNFLFESLYCLKEAVIHVDDIFRDEGPTYDFFDIISNVESLSINLYCIMQYYRPQAYGPISLPNLKTLELKLCGLFFENVLVSFLTCFPDPESLHLIITKDTDVIDFWRVDEAETMRLTRDLKKVLFLDFNEDKSKLDFARSLLEHGNALEEMVFSWESEARFLERSLETMKEVAKASSTVKLGFEFNPGQIYSRPGPEISETD